MTPAAKSVAAAMLRAERDMQDDLEDAVTYQPPTQLQRARSESSRLMVLGVILLAARGMQGRIERAVTDGRRDARERALVTLGKELDANGLEAVTKALRAPDVLLAEDSARSAAAAASLAAQWQAMATYAALNAQRRGKSVDAALRSTKGPMRDRVKRTAVTEASNAFNGERREALRDAADRHPEVKAALRDAGLFRQWTAELDACDACGMHEGEVVGIYEEFAGGDEPGEMHAHCRCLWVLVNETNLSRAA